MKKLILMSLTFAALALVGCNKNKEQKACEAQAGKKWNAQTKVCEDAVAGGGAEAAPVAYYTVSLAANWTGEAVKVNHHTGGELAGHDYYSTLAAASSCVKLTAEDFPVVLSSGAWNSQALNAGNYDVNPVNATATPPTATPTVAPAAVMNTGNCPALGKALEQQQAGAAGTAAPAATQQPAGAAPGATQQPVAPATTQPGAS